MMMITKQLECYRLSPIIIRNVVLHANEWSIQRNDFIYSSNEAGRFNVGDSVLRPLNWRVMRVNSDDNIVVSKTCGFESERESVSQRQ